MSLFFKPAKLPETKFVEPDKSVPLMKGDNALSLLKNPDRGLRMELYITLGEELDTYPTYNENPFERAQETIEKFASDSPTLSQVYVYLCNYNDRPLDELAFEQMKRFFEIFRRNNVRMLLRFTYSTEARDDAPYKIVKTHLNQISKWFGENQKLIDDTLYCLQTGIIGWWGEGHTYKNLKSGKIPNVIADVCALAPEGIYSQVRTYDLLKKVSSADLPRVGIHDDYIIGDITHKWSFIPKNAKNIKKFEKTMQHIKQTVNDGEMPWGNALLDDSATGQPLNSLDGKAVISQLQAYCLTSLSLEHNYKGHKEECEGSMCKWQKQFLTLGEAQKAGMTVNPSLFENTSGKAAAMSVYDIVRHHLGYQLVLSNYRSEDKAVSFSITNYGYAAPHNFNYLAVVFKNSKSEKLTEVAVESYDKTKLLSGAGDIYRIDIPEGCVPVGVKLDRLAGKNLCVRFANETKFENGIQYFA